MTTETKIHLSDLEGEIFELLPDIDEDTYIDDIVALFENAKDPVHPELLRIAAHRVGYFLDGGDEPDEDDVSGEHSQSIVDAAKATADVGDSDKDALFEAIARLQVEWFWGDMNTDAAEVTSIKELISRIGDASQGTSVSDFIYWNILEPWEEFVGEGVDPEDEDYMESFNEWKQAVESFLTAVEEPAS